MSDQQKALRLAEVLSSGQYNNGTAIQAAEQIRRQHAEWVSMMAERRHTECKLAAARAKIEKLRALLIRYRNETPLGHQPHMIAHEVDKALKEKK